MVLNWQWKGRASLVKRQILQQEMNVRNEKSLGVQAMIIFFFQSPDPRIDPGTLS